MNAFQARLHFNLYYTNVYNNNNSHFVQDTFKLMHTLGRSLSRVSAYSATTLWVNSTMLYFSLYHLLSSIGLSITIETWIYWFCYKSGWICWDQPIRHNWVQSIIIRAKKKKKTNRLTVQTRITDRSRNFRYTGLRWMIPPMVVHPEKIDFRRFV